MQMPSDLTGRVPSKDLTLMEAVEIFLQYPSIRNCPTKQRYGYCLANIVEKLGRDKPVKSIWVPDLRLYQTQRLTDLAVAKSKTKSKRTVTPGTVNRELSTLSRLFTILIELEMVDTNPCRLVKRLRPGHREVYISFQDFQRLVDACTPWYRPILQMAYYTGMRRSEVFHLTRRQVNLNTRIIRLGDRETKERKSKRVPIHKNLVPILEQCLKVTSLKTDRVFVMQGEEGIRVPCLDSTKNPWRRRISKLGFDSQPRFHDLRHSFKVNARRSGMHPEIEMAIMGHSQRGGSVHERYGRIGDQELVEAVDRMTFDHGETEIWARR